MKYNYFVRYSTPKTVKISFCGLLDELLVFCGCSFLFSKRFLHGNTLLETFGPLASSIHSDLFVSNASLRWVSPNEFQTDARGLAGKNISSVHQPHSFTCYQRP